MKVKATNTKTGQSINIEADDIAEETIAELSKNYFSQNEIKNFIDNLSLSPEVKTILWSVAETTITIGKSVISIGSKIIEMIIFFVKKNPNTFIGIIVGSILGIVLSGIPVLGFILGWLLKPLCIALGMGLGFWKDMQEINLKLKVESAVNDMFGGLSGISPADAAA